MGDAIIQLTAGPKWTRMPYRRKEIYLTDLFAQWSKIESSGLPIRVQVVDPTGRVLMNKARR